MDRLHAYWRRVVNVLEPTGDWVALLPIRLLIGYEFGSAGLRKFNASETLWGDVPSWFAKSIDNFPFPVSMFPASFNWFMVTWIEILGGLALVLGLFTRFWAFSLIIVTWVAILGVHWPESYSSLAELWKGYAVSDKGFGNFRIPLLFLVMLVPLVFKGAGKLSLDHVLARRFR